MSNYQYLYIHVHVDGSIIAYILYIEVMLQIITNHYKSLLSVIPGDAIHVASTVYKRK